MTRCSTCFKAEFVSSKVPSGCSPRYLARNVQKFRSGLQNYFSLISAEAGKLLIPEWLLKGGGGRGVTDDTVTEEQI